jgi:hypothetical protein
MLVGQNCDAFVRCQHCLQDRSMTSLIGGNITGRNGDVSVGDQHYMEDGTVTSLITAKFHTSRKFSTL